MDYIGGSAAGGEHLATHQAGDVPLTPLWAAYFALVLIGFGSQVISAGALVAAAAEAWRRRRRLALESKAVAVVEKPVAAIVPCYLPNEASIVRETVEHLLFRLTSVERLDVHLVYNTPRELPVEAELQALAEGPMPEGRRFFVERVPGSTSKAENLNHAIPQISAEYVAIYDADHRPDPDSLALAISHLEAMGVDCVQGSTYIRAGCCLAEGLTQAEFFVTYFVMLPITEALTGMGFFGGSNGVWQASSLAKVRFDEQALTEDIDCFLRASLDHGLTFSFLPESCSGELLPSSLAALWRQRLRWTMGWDQATLRHASRFWDAQLSLRRRLGLYYIFVFRWLTLMIVAFVAIFNTIASLRHTVAHLAELPSPTMQEPHCIHRTQLYSTGLYAILVAFALLRAALHRPGWRLPCSVMLYFMALPMYVFFNAVLLSVSLLRLASGNTGKWVVTSRYQSAPESMPESPGKQPLLGPPNRRLSKALLAVAILIQGALAGSVVGYFFAQRTVTHPLWGWVPFGLFATTTTYTDGRVVIKGTTIGLGGAVVLLLTINILTSCCKRQR